MENKNKLIHISTNCDPNWMKPTYMKHSAHARMDSENATFGLEHQFTIQSSFAIQLMDQINDEIVKQIIQAAKEEGINDVYLLNKEFVLKAIRDALDKKNDGLREASNLCRITALELENKRLKEQVDLFYKENHELRNTKLELLEENKHFKNNLNLMARENADLRSRNIELSKSNSVSRTINALVEQNNEQLKLNQMLKSEVRNLEEERNKARAGCQRLREENEKLIIENGNLKKGNAQEIDLLRKRIKKLTDENKTLQTNFNDMVTAFKTVNNQYDSAKLIIKKLIKPEDEE